MEIHIVMFQGQPVATYLNKETAQDHADSLITNYTSGFVVTMLIADGE